MGEGQEVERRKGGGRSEAGVDGERSRQKPKIISKVINQQIEIVI